jgi:hypothetical protein
MSSTRRSALKFSVAALIAGTSTSTPALAGTANPDASLIALCAEAARCEERIRYLDQHGTCDGECEPACTAWDKTYKQIAELPAVTLAGIQAKARTLDLAVVRESVWSDGFDEYLEDPAAITRYLRSDGRIARSLVADLLALEALT